MSDRVALLEAALESRAEGIALFDTEGAMLFWNPAAEVMTGYSRGEMLAQRIPDPLEPLLLDPASEINLPSGASSASSHRVLVAVKNKLGNVLRFLAQREILRDAVGGPIGAAVSFHLAQTLDALPHGETRDSEAEEIETSQEELEDRLQLEFDDFVHGGQPFGVLWINVDQAEHLHKTHGVSACHEMLGKVRRSLAQGLRPSEAMGRWGGDEFLIIAHEQSGELLAAHARMLVGLARTADFRWWGDRVSLTVSIGAAQAPGDAAESLSQLLARAQGAMVSSSQAGGNRVTVAAPAFAAVNAVEENTCSPS